MNKAGILMIPHGVSESYGVEYNCVTDAEELAQECLDSLSALGADTLDRQDTMNEKEECSSVSDTKQDLASSFRLLTACVGGSGNESLIRLAHPSAPVCLEDTEDAVSEFHPGRSGYVEESNNVHVSRTEEKVTAFSSHEQAAKYTKEMKPCITKARRKPRRPKTYTKPVPSRFCHICSRVPRKESPHLACGNIYKGTCRKTICKRCFLENGWNWEGANLLGENWKCTHCVGKGCPKRAQCHIYERTNKRRKTANSLSRQIEPNLPGENGYSARSDLLEKLVRNLPVWARQYEHVNREDFGYVNIAPNFNSVNVT